MGVINVKNIKYDYGKFIVKNFGSSISPSDKAELKELVQNEIAAKLNDENLLGYEWSKG